MMFDWLSRKQRLTDVRKMPTYVITPNSDAAKWIRRRAAIELLLRRRRFKDWQFVRGATGPTPITACAASHALAVMKALERKPFAPFLLLEDDVIDHKHVSTEIYLPPDADAFYLGVSQAGVDVNPTFDNPYIHCINGNYFSLLPTDCRRDVQEQVVQVYNMLSAHAVVIASERFARNWLICVTECLSRNIPFDIFAGLTHAYFNVYALRAPLFYQNFLYGGQESSTRYVLQGRGVIDRDSFLRLRKDEWPPSVSVDLARAICDDNFAC